MEKMEKINQLISKIGGIIDSFNGRDKFITGCNESINIKDYFPRENAPYGSFIHKLHKDHIEIVIPHTPVRRMIDTQVHICKIKYEQLTLENTDKLYEKWCK